MKFNQQKFYSTLLSAISPHEILVGDIIKMSNLTLFEIDDITVEYVDLTLVDTNNPEKNNLDNLKYTFYGTNFKDISEIPYNAEFAVFRSVEPVDIQFINFERIEKYNKLIQEKINKGMKEFRLL